MKKFLLVLVLGLSLINITYGQTQQDSIEGYNKVKKWAVVKLTIAYMEDLKGWPPLNNDYSNSNKIEVDTYNKLKQKFDLYTEDIDLDDVNGILSNGWGLTRDGVFNKYKIALIDSVDANNFENIQFIPEKTKSTQNRSIAIELINEKYNSLLPKQEKAEKIAANGEVILLQTDLKPIANENKDKSNLRSIALYLLLTISVLLNMFLIFKKQSKSKNIVSKNEDHQDYNLIKNRTLELEKAALVNEIRELKRDVEKYKVLSKKDEVNNQIEEVIEDQKSTTIEFEIHNSKENTKSTKRIIYFPSPFENKRFASEDMSESEKATSLYVAEIDKHSNRGIISLMETADLSRALNSPNTFLERVCDYENAYNPTAKGIKVMKDGEVVLDGEDWVVVNKIRIKFI